MKNKSLSLIIILGIYLVAITAAVWTLVLLYNHITSVILLLFIADAVATVVVYIFSLVFKNASVYDPYWSVIPPFLALGYYCLTGVSFAWLHLLVLIPLAIWAIRLTYNWTKHFENLKWQDWRYTNYERNFPKLYPLISFFGIMFMPTLLVFAGMVPFYFAITGAVNALTLALGGAVILGAATYQATADFQLRRFIKKSENKGSCIDEGLWKFSRHPNYFGEITVWWGMFIVGLSNFNWLSLIGAVLITCLFFFISVPLMEGSLLKSHPTYANYKSVVRSPIIPFIRKKEGK